MQEVVLASSNKGKLAEFRSALLDYDINLIPQSQFDLVSPPETGITFVENALIKARFAAEKTGLSALADDSGLCVPALNGAPGVYSARYAGEDATDTDNINALLEAMSAKAGDDRRAYFICVLVLLNHPEDPQPLIASGLWSGTIALEASGTQGFGYDPIFVADNPGVIAASLSVEQKSRFSHRGTALVELKRQLDLTR